MAERSSPWAALAAALLVAAIAVAVLPGHLINHDVAQFMYGGRAALGGLALYRDFVEMNLPTVYYISAVPVLLAEATGLSNAAGLELFVFLLAAASLALSARHVEPGQAAILVAVMLIPALPHFGQREHLFALAVLPYVLGFIREPEGPWAARLAVGFLAGLGLCLKPYFALLPLTMEALFWNRRPRLESVVAAAVGGMCLAAGLLRNPEYLTLLVPLAHAGYAAWNKPLFAVLGNGPLLMGAAALLFATLLPCPPQEMRRRLVLAGATAACLAIGTAQRKIYDYHFLPAAIFGLLLLVDVLAAQRERNKTVLCAAALAMLVDLSAGAIGLPFTYHDTVRQLAPVIRQYGHGRPIAAISIHVFPAFPLLMREGGTWGFRFPSLWPLEAVRKNPEAQDPELDLTRRMVAEDMRNERPCVVVVDRIPWGDQPPGLLDYLNRDPDFAAQWQAYRLVAKVPGYHVYSRCAANADSGEARGFP